MTLIPEGTWRGRGVTYKLGYTNQGGEQVGVEFQFSPDQHEEVDGYHLTWYGGFSEKAEPFTLKTLRTLGWTGDDLSDLTGIDQNECEAVVVHEEDLQGELRARIRFINPLGAGGVAMKNAMTEDQARAFAERMRGRVLAMNKAAPPPSAAPKAAANGGAVAAAAAAAKARTAAKGRAGTKAGKAAQATAPEADEGDDIPF